MKQRSSVWTAGAVLTIVLLCWSCNKLLDIIDQHRPPKPAPSGCEVSEYHLSLFDGYWPGLAFLFRKKYDTTGKLLQELDCSFNSDLLPEDEREHDLAVVRKGSSLFLMNKYYLPDTVMKVTFNSEGRPLQSTTNPFINDTYGNLYGDTIQYIYKEDRIFSIKVKTTPVPHFGPFSETDTVFYDMHGNPIAFRDNTYEYDYTRTAKQQFYIDDEMSGVDAFYILEYLGYFPELTSPPNIRTHAQNEVRRGYLTNQVFDAEGKLISYAPGYTTSAKITWNCH